jgi:hypothetical protein
MNEKIKQLADQAWALADQFQEQWKAGPSNEEFFQEKFAELIVRECADACYKHKDVESFGIYPVRVAMVTKACSDNIKQHFGVEE